MSGIFISYVREDSQGEAGRIGDWLRLRYGSGHVHRDVDDGPPGVPFPPHLISTVKKCRVVVVVIGRRWIQSLDARIGRDEDWVRVEVSTALSTPGVTVIPVLVQGATMPRSDQLPDDIRELAMVTAQELSDSRWQYDISRLVALIDRFVTPASGTKVLALCIGRAAVIAAIGLVAMRADLDVSTLSRVLTNTTSECSVEGSEVVQAGSTSFRDVRHLATLTADHIAADVRQGTFGGRTYRWVETYPGGLRGGVQLRWAINGHWHYCTAAFDDPNIPNVPDFAATPAVPTAVGSEAISWQACLWRSSSVSVPSLLAEPGLYTEQCTSVAEGG